MWCRHLLIFHTAEQHIQRAGLLDAHRQKGIGMWGAGSYRLAGMTPQRRRPPATPKQSWQVGDVGLVERKTPPTRLNDSYRPDLEGGLIRVRSRHACHGGAVSWCGANSIMGTRTIGVPCYRNCYRTLWDGQGKKRMENARTLKMCR